MDVLFSNIVIW